MNPPKFDLDEITPLLDTIEKLRAIIHTLDQTGKYDIDYHFEDNFSPKNRISGKFSVKLRKKVSIE